MGSSSAFFTFLSQKPRSKRFVRAFFAWLALQFLVPICIIGLLFPAQWVEVIWHGENLGLVLLAFMAIFMQGPVWSVIQNAGESQRRTEWVQGISMIVVTAHLVAVVLLWVFDWLGLYAIFTAIALEYLIAAIITHKKYSYSTEEGNNTASLEDESAKEKLEEEEKDVNEDALGPMFKKYWAYCLPLIPYSWIGFAYIFADRWLLQNYSGSVEQAYYAVAAQLAAVALIVTTSILRIFWKEISEAHKKGEHDRAGRLYQKVSRLLFFICAVIAGLFIPWTEEIIREIIGEEYVGGATTLAIMFFFPAFQTMGQIGSTMLYASERVSIQSIVGSMFMISSMVVTYFALAPSDAALPGLGLGSEGLALKMIVMQVIQVNIYAYIISRIWNWSYDWLYQPVSLLVCIGGGWLISLAFGSSLPLFIALVLYGFFYMLLVAVFIYSMPWLIGMTRDETVSSVLTIFRKLQKITN